MGADSILFGFPYITMNRLYLHARRSHLVYEKAYGPGTEVGVIAWEPSAYAAGPWWRSSERSIEFLVQSVGYFYELLLNSGRA